MSAAIVETLYLGTDMRGATVSDDEWKAFIESIVTPELSEGFTTWDANGQWRAKDGRIDRERSHLLQFIHAPSEDYTAQLERIVTEYRRRFKQEAVLRTSETICSKMYD